MKNKEVDNRKEGRNEEWKKLNEVIRRKVRRKDKIYNQLR